MKIGEILKSMVSDSKTGSISSKRVISIAGFLALVIAMFINIIWGRNVTPNVDLINAVKEITFFALGAGTADKLMNRIGKSDTQVTESTVEIKSKTVEPSE